MATRAEGAIPPGRLTAGMPSRSGRGGVAGGAAAPRPGVTTFGGPDRSGRRRHRRAGSP